MKKNNDFWKKNLTWLHVAGIVAGVLLALLYWYKSGQFSDNILKKSPVLMGLWGLLTGYILVDLVKSSRNRDGENK